ncbi:hypothetical protein P692DRAFT_20752677, partial [Suillus brevipes Sb2]
MLTSSTNRPNTHLRPPQNSQTFAALPYPTQDRTTPTLNQIPPVDAALARSAIRARQVLLDPIAGNLTFPPEISHQDALSKLCNAIKEALSPNDRDDNIKALLQLRNRGLIIELDSEETITRLQDNAIRKKLLHALNYSVTFKDRTYTLVAQ